MDALPVYLAICQRAIIQKFYFHIDRRNRSFDKLELIAAAKLAPKHFSVATRWCERVRPY